MRWSHEAYEQMIAFVRGFDRRLAAKLEDIGYVPPDARRTEFAHTVSLIIGSYCSLQDMQRCMNQTFGHNFTKKDILANTRGLVKATNNTTALRVLRYIHGERKDIIGPWMPDAVKLMVALHEDIHALELQDVLLWKNRSVKTFWNDAMLMGEIREVRKLMAKMRPWVPMITYTIWRGAYRRRVP